MGEVTALDRTITWLDEVGIVYQRAVSDRFIPNKTDEPIMLDPFGTVLHIADDNGPRQGGYPNLCGARHRLEVNHIVPRDGAGYRNGCHHHQDGLETLCHAHHVEETNRQRRARRDGLPLPARMAVPVPTLF